MTEKNHTFSVAQAVEVWGPTQEDIVAKAIMLDDGCGLTINGQRTLCDDPRAMEKPDRCYCRRSAKAALAALAQPPAAPVETGCTSSDGGGESRPASTEPQASASRRPQGLIGEAGVAPSPSDPQCSADTESADYVHIDNVVYHLDDIEVGEDGKCAWTDVANALTHIKLCREHIPDAPQRVPDDEIDYDDPKFNQGVQHVVDLLSKTLGAEGWVAGDGSEDYDCDLEQTLLNILAAKGLYDKDEGEFASLAVSRPKIEVRRLSNGEYTSDGAFWPMVDGENIGENDRTHWHTEAEARAAAERYIASILP